jgi:hypothetical protein
MPGGESKTLGEVLCYDKGGNCVEDTVVHILNTIRGISLSSVDRSECSTGLEMAQYFAKEVLEVEPLEAQRVDVLEGP